MLGETSDFGAIDLLGVLGVNALGSHMACANPTLRVGIKNKSGDVPAFLDFRFITGTVAAIVAQFSGEYTTVARVAHDVATGTLGSYVATETCRRAALKRIEDAQKSTEPTGPVAQLEDAGRRAGRRGGAGPAVAVAPDGGGRNIDEATGYDW